MPKSDGGGVSGIHPLGILPPEEWASLRPELERVPLAFKQVIEPPDRLPFRLAPPAAGVGPLADASARIAERFSI